MSTDVGSPATRQPNVAPKSPRAFLVVTGVIALVLSTFPYVAGYFGNRAGVYLWAGTSPSDFAVYLAWIRAAADGSLRDPHLFAGGHPGMLINPIYWVMGLVVRVTGLPGTFVYHASRAVCGAFLLYVLWRFVRMCTRDPLERRLAFLFLCFSSGFGWCLGWLPLKFWSIDRWQPEAFTFLSLYSYPHFCVALALQVATLGFLSKAVTSGRYRYAVCAGLCALVLAVVHTYDVITLAFIWLAYAAAPKASGGRARAWIAGLIAGVLTAPGIVYIYMAMRSDRVFAQRVDEPTMSAPLYTILIGYGGVLLLAILGARMLTRRDPSGISSDPQQNDVQSATPLLGKGAQATRGANTSSSASTSSTSPSPIPMGEGEGGEGPSTHPEMASLLIIWAIVNIAVSYLPVLFQRKMLQGELVALCVLAAIGAAALLRRAMPRADWRNVRMVEVLLAGFLSIGSALYLYHDTRDILSGREQHQYRSTLTTGEVDALTWVRANTPVNAIVQPVPWFSSAPRRQADGSIAPDRDSTLALFLPGLTGRAVYAGHWAETPDFDKRVADIRRLAFAPDPVDDAGVDYLLVSTHHDGPPYPGRFDVVYKNDDILVLHVKHH